MPTNHATSLINELANSNQILTSLSTLKPAYGTSLANQYETKGH
jgi:hypothetical protein